MTRRNRVVMAAVAVVMFAALFAASYLPTLARPGVVLGVDLESSGYVEDITRLAIMSKPLLLAIGAEGEVLINELLVDDETWSLQFIDVQGQIVELDRRSSVDMAVMHGGISHDVVAWIAQSEDSIQVSFLDRATGGVTSPSTRITHGEGTGLLLEARLLGFDVTSGVGLWVTYDGEVLAANASGDSWVISPDMEFPVRWVKAMVDHCSADGTVLLIYLSDDTTGYQLIEAQWVGDVRPELAVEGLPVTFADMNPILGEYCAGDLLGFETKAWGWATFPVHQSLTDPILLAESESLVVANAGMTPGFAAVSATMISDGPGKFALTAGLIVHRDSHTVLGTRGLEACGGVLIRADIVVWAEPRWGPVRPYRIGSSPLHYPDIALECHVFRARLVPEPG